MNDPTNAIYQETVKDRSVNTPVGPTPQPGKNGSHPAPEIEKNTPSKIKTSWTLAELLNTEFPEPNWVVPSIIQEGLVELVARPKIGKSWMALGISGAVGCGGKYFNKDIVKGEVLYFALEDNPRRIKDRCGKMGIVNGDIQFEFTWKPLHKGGLNDLLIAITKTNYRLIVIDTLSRALPGVNHNDEQPIGSVMDQLHDLATNHGTTILTVDHTRKANGFYPDPIDDVMGSTAKARALDSVLGIYKENGKVGAILRGRGRETEELELSIFFDKTTYCWQSRGNAFEVEMTDAKNAIMDYLEDAGKSQCAAIAKGLKKDRSNVFRQLQDLVNAGLVAMEDSKGKVYYDLS